MAILKLQNEGESHTARVQSCAEVAGQYGAQVKFDFEGGDTLYLPKDSADRQLARIPLTYAECEGEILTFSRDHNSKPGAKPFWGIKLASAGDAVKPSGKRIETPYADPKKKPLPFDEDAFPSKEHGESVADPLPPEPEWASHNAPPKADTANVYKRKAIADSYLGLLKYVIEHSALTDQQAIQSAAATIFIQWKNAGVV